MSKECRDQDREVFEWLQRQGYPLEMSVAQSFDILPLYDASLGNYYEDQDTGKMREIDILAQAMLGDGRTHSLRLCYLVECKTDKDDPWVILKSEAESSLIPTFLYVYSQVAYELMFRILYRKKESLSMLYRLPVFRYNNDIGHGIARARISDKQNKNRTDYSYVALSSSIKSSFYYSRFPDKPEFVTTTAVGLLPYISAISIPTIILNGDLYECWLDESDQPRIKRIESGVVRWSGFQGPTIVHIYTKDAIPKLMIDAVETANIFGQIVQDEKDSLIELGKSHRDRLISESMRENRY